jgi:hypothetical protein
LLLYSVLAALTVVAYFPVWRNDFIDYDDSLYITGNNHVLRGLAWSEINWAWKGGEGPYWMPVTWISLQFDAQFFSIPTDSGQFIPSPIAVHGQNLLWHSCSALLLFGLLRRLTGNMGNAFLAAALFAIHPMHVESVAWAIERKDVLMAFFGILTLWAYVRYVEAPSCARYAWILIAYPLSLMSKPMLITLPFVLLLLDYWPLRRVALRRTWRGSICEEVATNRVFLEKFPLFLIALLIAGNTVSNRAGVPLTEISYASRLMNALTAYGSYLHTTFYPLHLAILYPHPRADWSWANALAGAVVLASVTGFCAWQARRRPWLIVGWLWFLGCLLPVIGFAQGGSQAWADRFSYWPHIGLFIAVVWGLDDAAARIETPRRLFQIAWALALTGLMSLTWTQIGYWRSSVVVWEHALEVTQHNDLAHQHLAICYRRLGREEEAMQHLFEAVNIQRMRRDKGLRQTSFHY